MTDYKPGQVATMELVAGRAGRFRGIRGVSGWYSGKYGYSGDEHVTDVRPLVVLDLDWAESVPVLIAQLRGAGYVHIADQIEAQAKPPRIPEPGLWGVVESTVTYEGTTYSTSLVRHPGPGTANRWLDRSGSWFSWNELIDPVLIREGVA
jgi:hypothetical protein